MKATGAIALAVGLLLAAPASAKTTEAVPYPAAELWSTAIRFLRVDRGFPVREKDEAAGYVLFDYVESGRTYHGALEVIPVGDVDGRPGARLVISLPELPHRYESGLLEKLAGKIRDELGPPAPRHKAGDRGSDKDDKADKGNAADKDKSGARDKAADRDADKDDDKGQKRGTNKSKAGPDAPGAGLPRLPEAVTP